MSFKGSTIKGPTKNWKISIDRSENLGYFNSREAIVKYKSVLYHQDTMVRKRNRSHCIIFLSEFMFNLCTVTVIELVVFSYN
jgi:hypothetical protein